MNPGVIDIPAAYSAPVIPAAGVRPALGPSGSSAPEFSAPIPLWVGRLTPPTKASTEDQAGGPRATADTTFLARWASGLADGGRLVAEGRTYDITGITAAPGTARRSWVHISCRHVAGVNSTSTPATAFP